MTTPVKKAAVKHAPHEDAAKDMRRAYEHLGRVEILHASLDPHAAAEITELMKLAQHELAATHVKDAADLLRAAEHLSFGALGSQKKDAPMDAKLVEAITEEFHGKLKKADQHWSAEEHRHKTIDKIYNAVIERANKAFGAGAYRQALELARGAEALAHVHIAEPKKLGAEAEQHQLTA